MSHNRVLVLVGGSDPQTISRFAEVGWTGLDLRIAEAPDASSASCDLMIVTPFVSEPLGKARSFRRMRPSGPLLFVVASEQLERMRRLLPFSPELAGAGVLDAAASDAEIETDVRRMLASAGRLRDIAGLYSRINAQLGATRIAEPAPGGRDERHLALAERYLTAILANAPDALMAVALDGAVVSWNEAAVRLFDISLDAVAGRGFVALFVPDHRPGAASLLKRATMGESVGSQRLAIETTRAGVLTLEISAGPVLGGGGAIEGVSLIARDVTARERDELELLRLNEDLEARVVKAVAERERTAAALRQAQKMEAVGQLTGGVAHDFNNLLTVIMSSIDLLRRPNLAEERRKRYLEAISDTVGRAAKLTGQLLAFARQQPLKPEIFDVAEQIASVTAMLRPIVGSRIAIQTNVRCEQSMIDADISQFETAMVNIALNARDAMEGEGTLTIDVDAMEEMPAIRGHLAGPGAFIAIAIADTGGGIPDDLLTQIFEPFFTTKDVGKGTGLGLSQVFGFAKQSGGDIAVSSTKDVGTTFTLYLPHAVGMENASRPDQPSAVQEEPVTGRHVLVVEDNVEVGRFANQILRDLGFTTTWASNAREALDLLAGGWVRFDIVFSDVVMPGMNGIELGKIIRRDYPELPIVLASGYSHVLAHEGRHGFELIQKPYAAGDVARVLNRMARMPERHALAGC